MVCRWEHRNRKFPLTVVGSHTINNPQWNANYEEKTRKGQVTVLATIFAIIFQGDLARNIYVSNKETIKCKHTYMRAPPSPGRRLQPPTFHNTVLHIQMYSFNLQVVINCTLFYGAFTHNMTNNDKVLIKTHLSHSRNLQWWEHQEALKQPSGQWHQSQLEQSAMLTDLVEYSL